nr:MULTISPECIES: hypothetical protein [Rodentibacter]
MKLKYCACGNRKAILAVFALKLLACVDEIGLMASASTRTNLFRGAVTTGVFD